MTSNQQPPPPPSTQQGTAEGERGEVSTQRHPNGSDVARPKHSALAHREYGLLTPEDASGDPAVVWTQGSRDTHKGQHGDRGHQREGYGYRGTKQVARTPSRRGRRTRTP